jgi:hypothetical protein
MRAHSTAVGLDTLEKHTTYLLRTLAGVVQVLMICSHESLSILVFARLRQHGIDLQMTAAIA